MFAFLFGTFGYYYSKKVLLINGCFVIFPGFWLLNETNPSFVHTEKPPAEQAVICRSVVCFL